MSGLAVRLLSSPHSELNGVASLTLIVPTTYWVRLRLPKLRPVVEFIALMPFVVPAIPMTRIRGKDSRAIRGRFVGNSADSDPCNPRDP